MLLLHLKRVFQAGVYKGQLKEYYEKVWQLEDSDGQDESEESEEEESDVEKSDNGFF
jgi:hypothetical protein